MSGESDINRLLRRHTSFDGSSADPGPSGDQPSCSINDDLISKLRSVSPHAVITLVLLQIICNNLEGDTSKKAKLFKSIVQQLCDNQYLDFNAFLLCDPILRQPQLRDTLTNFIEKMHIEIARPSSNALLHSSSISANLDMPLMISPKVYRYKDEFEQLGVIAKCASGVVCKSRHKLDRAIYAIKKIFFKYKNEMEFEKIIREAKSFACLQHVNIVQYNNAWLGDEEQIEEISDSDESTEEDSSNPKFGTNPKIYVSTNSDENKRMESKLNSTNQVAHSSSSHEDSTVISSEIVNCSNTNYVSADTNKSHFQEEIIANVFKPVLEPIHNSVSSQQLEKTDPAENEKDLKSDAACNTIVFPNLQGPRALLNLWVTLYIQMEYCECDLRTWLDKRVSNEGSNDIKLNPMKIFQQVLRGVEHIHSKSIIHRDLKPKNIFISEKTGIVKIGDFGLACLVHQTDEQPCLHCSSSEGLSCVFGTLPYAAPEQRNGKEYDFKVDIYSLGIILLELISPCQTFMEFSVKVENALKGEFPYVNLNDWQPHVDAIMKMIDIDPKNRPNTTELLQSHPFKKKSTKRVIDELNGKISNMMKEQTIMGTIVQHLQDAHVMNLKEIREMKENYAAKEQEVRRLEDRIRVLESEKH